MAALALSPCTAEGCENFAAAGGLCWAHIKQRQRGRSLRAVRTRGKSAWELLFEAGLVLFNADTGEDTDDVFELKLERFRAKCREWVMQERKDQNDG